MLLSKETIEITEHGVLSILSNHRKISIEAYALGNPEKVEILIDLDLLLTEANLTERQRQIVELYYIEQRTQEQTAEALGISQQRVQELLPVIKGRIKAVARKWGESN